MLKLMKQLFKIISLIMYIMPLHESDVRHPWEFVVSYVRGNIHYAIQQLSPSVRLHCTHQGLHTSPHIVFQVS